MRRGPARTSLAVLPLALLVALVLVVGERVPRVPAVPTTPVSHGSVAAAATPRPGPVLKPQDSPRQVGLAGVLGLLFVGGLVVTHVRVLRAVSAAGRRSTGRPAPSGRPGAS